MTWSTKAVMPAARYGAAAGAIAGKLYVAGGDLAGSQSTLWEYNPATDSWATKAAMPDARNAIYGGVIGTKLYVAGGHDAAGTVKNTLYEYDQVANTWATKAVVPAFLGDMGLAVIGTKLYAAGGYEAGFSYNSLYEWDQGTNTWATMATLPAARGRAAVGAIGTKVYVAGGYANGATDTLYEWDQGTNTWATKAAMPSVSYGAAAAVVNGKLYVMGGSLTSGADKDTLYEYNPASNTWATLDVLPIARYFSGGAAIGTKVYAAGGTRQGAATDTLYEFEAGVAPNAPTLVAPAAASTEDLAAGYTFDWTFSDPDAGDTQTAWAIRRKVGAGAYEYYNVAAGTWGGTLVWNTDTATQFTFPASKWTNGNTYSWSINTKDTSGLVGTFASDFTVTTPPGTPTAVSPVEASTVTTDVPTLSATIAAQNTNAVTITWQLATDAGFTTDLRVASEAPGDAKVSGVATLVLPTGSQLFTGAWYVRARAVNAGATAGPWSAANAFTVSHPPSTAGHVPTGGTTVAFGASGEVALSWTFSDPSPTDTQTAYQIIVERNDTGAPVLDTGKVASTAGSGNVTIPANQKDQPLRWKIRVYDSDDVVGAYSGNQLFTVSDAPVGTITSPTEGQVVATPQPTITWTFTASGRTQASYRVRVFDDLAALVYDSGAVVSAALSHALPDNTLVINSAYTVELAVTDNTGLASTPHTVAFTTAWTPPAAPAFTVTI